MNNLNNIISLVLGDWSHDGHSKADTVVIKSNFTVKEIEKAYKKATKKLGFDLINDVAADYEDNKLSKDKMKILLDNGFKYELEESDSENHYLWIDSFTDIYLFIVKMGDESFEHIVLEGDLKPTIHIGGYGLYT